MTEDLLREDPELEMLRRNKESGYLYRERRHTEWDENYLLYRDKVQVNRLTQRQSVNIPLMKQTIRTLLKDVDDMPVLYFENLDNDKEAEIFKNEYWKVTVDENRMDLQDIIDKRQVFLFGRSFDQWQIVDGKVKMTVQDPMDILVSRYTDPFNIHSSRFLIHLHNFIPLSELENDEENDQVAVGRIKQFFASQEGIVKASDNHQMLVEKNRKMAAMGDTDVDDPILGETYVEITLHFVFRDHDNDTQIMLYVEAEDQQIIKKKPLEEVIGVTEDHYFRYHYPYCSWGDDIERQDFWSDGIADIVRTPNKILNSWFSQLVENRTLRNFGMHYYDSNAEGFEPQTFQPIPWGWYGVPGNPNEVIQKVDIPDLSESLDEMQFLINMAEKATGATATQQGMQTERQITLGEVQLALGEAKERIKGMSKFYTPAWEQRGEMFIKMVEAASDKLDAVKVYKQGRNTRSIYSREISATDWQTQSGYRCKVWSLDEKNQQQMESLQKLDAVKANMPDNPKLTEIYQRKLLEFAGLNPDEINEVIEFEEQKREAMISMLGAGLPQPGGLVPGQSVASPPMTPPQNIN